MENLLTPILTNKGREVAARKALRPAGEVRAAALEAVSLQPRRPFAATLAASPTGIIAEFKRKSPSLGWIRPEARVEDVVTAYERAGATALSVLADETYFGGCLGFIRRARAASALPVLCKEFIVDDYQIFEAAEAGADAVLLIAACLERNQCTDLAAEAHRLGLEVLLELHSPAELDYVACAPDLVGVNNRSLGTFHTDAAHALTLADTLTQATEGMPCRPLLVAESGIHDPETACRLRQHGYRGLLIGERLMRGNRPGEELQTFIEQMSHLIHIPAL